MSGRIKVLIVDDSAIVRKILSEALSADPGIEVVGTAPDPIVAKEKIERLKPDVLTLDVEMPRMDGLTFLKQLMATRPMPVVMISSLGHASSRVAMEAMQCGAVEVIAKPGGPYSVGDLQRDLPYKIRAAAGARIVPARPTPPVLNRPLNVNRTDRAAIIALGASTGGTEALREVLTQMPKDSPPIVAVQHIPAVFSRAFAERLDGCCQMQVKEAEDGDEVSWGRVLIAPGNFHLTIRRQGGGYRAVVATGPLVCYQRPAVDVLFDSVAREAGRHAIAALLTGMGSDGAKGMLQMKQAGARTIAQDEQSCVVFGMPREAIRLGAANRVLPLHQIAQALLQDGPSGKAGSTDRQRGLSQDLPVR
jgi:two-component system chemotaxis response regulator CheB